MKSFKRPKYWIPALIGIFIVILLAGLLVYRLFLRPEEWRLYEQIKSPTVVMRWIYLVTGTADEYSDRRNQAFIELVKLEGKAIGPLMEALKDKSIPVRGKAMWALGEIGDPKALEPLIEATKDIDKSLRTISTMSLGKIGDPRALEALRKCLDDEHLDVQKAAKEALRKIENKKKPQGFTRNP